jgi:hypothetical protein
MLLLILPLFEKIMILSLINSSIKELYDNLFENVPIETVIISDHFGFLSSSSFHKDLQLKQ